VNGEPKEINVEVFVEAPPRGNIVVVRGSDEQLSSSFMMLCFSA